MNNSTETKDKIIKECQKVAEKTWRSSPMSHFMFAGFASIRFKGIANKKKLESLGFRVSKSYPSGFEINVDDLFEEPDYVRSVPNSPDGSNDTRATWEQSLTLKEAVGETACKILKKEGIDCWVSSVAD